MASSAALFFRLSSLDRFFVSSAICIVVKNKKEYIHPPRIGTVSYFSKKSNLRFLFAFYVYFSDNFVFLTIFFLSRVLYSKHIYPPGELGSPIIGIGLIGVIFGSILLLSVLIIDFLKQKI